MSASGQDTIYRMVTERIIEQLEKGTAPWQKLWSSAYPLSMSTGKPYRGINPMLLAMTASEAGYESQWWGSWKKITKLGGKLKDGEGKKYTIVVFWNRIVKTDKETGKDKVFFLLRYYRVYNAEQCDGLPEKYYAKPGSDAPDDIDTAEDIIKGYLANGGPKLRHGGDGANYAPRTDVVRLPAKSSFDDMPAYYGAAFHELTHSTGHNARLNRPGITEFDHFGSDKYGKEELVAHLGSAMLLSITGTDVHQDNDAAYIAGWLKTIKGDNTLVVKAAGQAQRAVDLIQGITFANDAEE